MKSFIKILVCLGLVVGIIGYFTWKQLWIALAPSVGEVMFRKEYHISGYEGDRHSDKKIWALYYFGGKTGLPSIQKIQNNDYITVEGKTLAKAMQTYLNSGQYLEDITKELQQIDRPLSWWQREFLAYVYERDKNQSPEL